jgi:threonine dehydrogenase-like Zn-dependent dehydrogenase
MGAALVIGVDVAIEALGTQQTFESSLRCLRPGGTLRTGSSASDATACSRWRSGRDRTASREGPCRSRYAR